MTLLWSIKNTAEPYYCSLLCFNVVSIVGHLPIAMDAVLATIADGGRVIIVIDKEAVEIN